MIDISLYVYICPVNDSQHWALFFNKFNYQFLPDPLLDRSLWKTNTGSRLGQSKSPSDYDGRVLQDIIKTAIPPLEEFATSLQ